MGMISLGNGQGWEMFFIAQPGSIPLCESMVLLEERMVFRKVAFRKYIDRAHKNSYELRCRRGYLDRQFHIQKLERIPDIVSKGIKMSIMNTRITLMISAEKEPRGTQARSSCQCIGNYNIKGRRYFKDF